MKTIITITVMALTVITSAFAQSAQIKIKAKETEIPVQVVQSFKEAYKGAEGTEWAIVPALFVEEEYMVSGYDDLNGEKPTSYEVAIKGHNIKAKAVYDKNGTLRYSKEVLTNVALPTVVREAVTRKYPGYALLKDQEIIKQGKSDIIHYRVVVEKGKEKLALAVDASGKILREFNQNVKGKNQL
jgi:hypothetical protein